MGQMSRDSLSIAEARRLALAAQGFDDPRPAGPVCREHLRRVIRRLGLIQIDCVTVLAPAHYQVLYSRLGPYDRSLLDDLVYQAGEFTEQWAHEASILPVETWPLLRHRMECHRVRPWGFEGMLEKHGEYVGWVMGRIREQGPLSAADLPAPDGAARRIPGAWIGTVPRAVLEAQFGRGKLAVATRRPDFSRVFELAERIIPPEHYSREIAPDDARRELLRGAARAQGIATAADLADYFRMRIGDARPRIAELVEAGDLQPVAVEGWREPAYLHKGAESRRIDAAALLSPFDPVVWFRPRAARLFAFEYRMEVFVPPARRRWGCYVLPFLLGERLVARVDLKADRARRRLLVPAAFLEPHADAGIVSEALAAELRVLAGWLSLDRIVVGRRGNFARRLSAGFKG